MLRTLGYGPVWLCSLGLVLGACGATKKETATSPPVVTELDVTGTYQTKGSGMMLVRKDEGDTYEIALLVQGEGPSYHSGEIKANLPLVDGKMQYLGTGQVENKCIIDFHFDTQGVDVRQDITMEQPDCEFGYGVTAMGYLEKTSSESPIVPSGPLGEQ